MIDFGNLPITPKEHEVLSLLTEGLSNKEIGARLGITDRTVKAHIAKIALRAGSKNGATGMRVILAVSYAKWMKEGVA